MSGRKRRRRPEVSKSVFEKCYPSRARTDALPPFVQGGLRGVIRAASVRKRWRIDAEKRFLTVASRFDPALLIHALRRANLLAAPSWGVAVLSLLLLARFVTKFACERRGKRSKTGFTAFDGQKAPASYKN